MAPAGKEPPDAALSKYYKCHPNTKVGAVVCIVCGSFQHTNEFVAKYNAGAPGKILTDSFIICQDHPNLALTSQMPYGALGETAGQFIAQLKQENREQIKQEILKELEMEKEKDKNSNSAENIHETTIYEHYTELESLRIENKILKELNIEMKEKNQLLNELLAKQKQEALRNIQTPKTFAEILTNTKSNNKTINKKVPKLIIKKTDSSDKTNLEKTVIHHLTKDKSIQTKNIINKNKDTIIINCMNEESVNKVEKSLKTELNKNVKIEKEQIRKPTVKVINIDKIFASDSEIEADINQRNFNNIDDKCKVLYVYSNVRSNTMSAILEVTPNIYKYIKENNNKMFVGYQNCRVFDIINTTPCNSCSRFGHSAKKCSNEATCYKCAGNHPASQCKNDFLKCPNCDFYNKKFNTNYSTNHSAIDSEQCEVLKNKINKYIETTEYPMRPTYPRYFGKTEQPRLQRSLYSIRKPRTLAGIATTQSPRSANS